MRIDACRIPVAGGIQVQEQIRSATGDNVFLAMQARDCLPIMMVHTGSHDYE